MKFLSLVTVIISVTFFFQISACGHKGDQDKDHPFTSDSKPAQLPNASANPPSTNKNPDEFYTAASPDQTPIPISTIQNQNGSQTLNCMDANPNHSVSKIMSSANTAKQIALGENAPTSVGSGLIYLTDQLSKYLALDLTKLSNHDHFFVQDSLTLSMLLNEDSKVMLYVDKKVVFPKTHKSLVDLGFCLSALFNAI